MGRGPHEGLRHLSPSAGNAPLKGSVHWGFSIKYWAAGIKLKIQGRILWGHWNKHGLSILSPDCSFHIRHCSFHFKKFSFSLYIFHVSASHVQTLLQLLEHMDSVIIIVQCPCTLILSSVSLLGLSPLIHFFSPNGLYLPASLPAWQFSNGCSPL